MNDDLQTLDEPKVYSNRSNARRAAKGAGRDRGSYKIEPVDGGYIIADRLPGEPDADEGDEPELTIGEALPPDEVGPGEADLPASELLDVDAAIEAEVEAANQRINEIAAEPEPPVPAEEPADDRPAIYVSDRQAEIDEIRDAAEEPPAEERGITIAEIDVVTLQQVAALQPAAEEPAPAPGLASWLYQLDAETPVTVGMLREAFAELDERFAAKPARAPREPKPPREPRPEGAEPRLTGRFVEMQANAEKGIVPPAPDFTADTYKPYMPRYRRLVALVEAGDLDALEVEPMIRPYATQPKALLRYRNMAVTALRVQRGLDPADAPAAPIVGAAQ